MSSRPDDTTFEYEGFSNPNGTIVPDDVFDVLMPRLADAELRVLLYIIRRTFGFKKNNDDISLRQMVEGIVTRDGRVLDRGTGLSKPTVARGLAGLRKKKIIVATRNRSAERGNEATTYRLRFRGDDDQASEILPDPRESQGRPPLSHQRDKGVSHVRDKGLSHQRDTQETGLQQTEVSLSNIRNGTPKNDFVDNSRSQPISSDASEASQQRHGMEDMATIMQRRRGRPRNSLQAALSTALTTVATTEAAPTRKRGRPRNDGYSEDRQRILAYVQDFARELRDRAPLRSSVTRAYNLFQRSGVHISRFEDAMYQAKAKTQEYSATIRAQADGGPFPVKTKMAYWFACLEDELGLKDDQDNASPPH